jgi:hypothetical protein
LLRGFFIGNFIMPVIIDGASETNDRTEDEREIIRKALTEIVQEVGAKMRAADLTYPVFMTVPSSGDAIMTFATPDECRRHYLGLIWYSDCVCMGASFLISCFFFGRD